MATNKSLYRQFNSNFAVIPAGSAGVKEAGVVLGAPDGKPHVHYYSDLRFALAKNNPAYVTQFDDFTGAAISEQWAFAGSGGSGAVRAGVNGGVYRLTTGGTDTNNYTLAATASWKVSNGVHVFVAKVASATALTSRAWEIGISDAVSETNGLAFSDHTVSGVTDVATDALVFARDTADSGTSNFVINTVNTGTPAAYNTGVAPVAGTFNKFTIIVDEDGDAWFYIDDDLIWEKAGAIATTALVTPWITIVTRTGSAASIDVDYVGLVGPRG